VDRWANRGELKRDRRFAELLDGARAPHGAKAHEAGRLAIPFGIDPVDRVLEHRGGAEVVFGRDEDGSRRIARSRRSISARSRPCKAGDPACPGGTG